MKKRMMAVILTLCICVLIVPAITHAESYSYINISGIPTFRQRKRYTIPTSINPYGVSVDVSVGGKYGDCGIDCIAMIEAYFKGYPSENDLVYHAAIAGRNPTIKWKTITKDPGDDVWVIPFPMPGYIHKEKMSAEEIYAQLKAGNPVMVHRKLTAGGYEHWVVIYGYDGPSDSLQWGQFMIMSPTSKEIGVEYLHLSNLISEGYSMLNGFMYRTSGIEELPPNGPFILDVNGYLDGKDASNIYNYGTFDIYLDGKRPSDGKSVGDYWNTEVKTGTAYAIKNVKPASGKVFAGFKSGAATSTVSGDTTIVMEFRSFSAKDWAKNHSPAKTQTYNGHTYKYFTDKVTRTEALHICNQLGGHLVSIDDNGENNFVSGIIQDTVWLSGMRIKGNTFCWQNTILAADGKMSYTNWAAGEPNNATTNAEGGEGYVTMYGSGDNRGKWNDIHGYNQYGFVCEINKDDNLYTLDVNGKVDGQPRDNIDGIGTFDYSVTLKGETKATTVSNVSDYYHSKVPAGSTYTFYNIKPAAGYEYTGQATYSGTVNGNTAVVLEFKKKRAAPSTVTLDVNGWMDGKELDCIEGIGTFDSYINGKKTENDICDYYNTILSNGTKYEFKDIKAADGYEFIGVKSGSLFGTMNGNVKVVLEFRRMQAVSVSFTPWESQQGLTYIGETDASLGQIIDVTGGNCTETGMVLYDSNDKQLATARNTGGYGAEHRVYFQMNAEANYTLTPDTMYRYRFYAIVDGTTYWSEVQTFKTLLSSVPATPTAMPATPTPTTAPATPTPTPTDVPSTPTPTPQPADPTPTDVPATPAPTEPPAEATPTVAPSTPVPTEAPVEATPMPVPTEEPTPTEPPATQTPTPQPADPTPAVETEAPATEIPYVRVRFEFDDVIGSQVALYDREVDLDTEWDTAFATTFSSTEELRLTPGTYWYAAWFNDDDWPDILIVQGSFRVAAISQDQQPLVIRIETLSSPVEETPAPARVIEAPSREDSTAQAYVTIVNVRNKLSVRKDASAETKRLGYAYNGEVYPLLAVKGKWYKIQYKENVVGYVHEDYVQATNEYLVPYMENTITPKPTKVPTPKPTPTEEVYVTEPPAKEIIATETPLALVVSEPPVTITDAPVIATAEASTVVVAATAAPALYPVASAASNATAVPLTGMPASEDDAKTDKRMEFALMGIGGMFVATQIGIASILIRRRRARVRRFRDDTDDFEEI